MDRSMMGGSADKGARGTRVALFLLVLMVTGRPQQVARLCFPRPNHASTWWRASLP